jgi:tetratricopeptide (TPR) repeat protein
MSAVGGDARTPTRILEDKSSMVARRLCAIARGMRLAISHLFFDILLSVGLGDTAVWLVRRQISKYPSREADNLSYLGYLEARRGNFDDAIEHLNAAIERAPNDAFVLVELGVAYEEKGRPDLALPNFERALSIGSDFGHDFRSSLEMKIRQTKHSLQK